MASCCFLKISIFCSLAEMGEGIRHSVRGPRLRLGRSVTSFHAFTLWRAHGLWLAPRAQAVQAAVDLMD
jgi:hypothetical protein